MTPLKLWMRAATADEQLDLAQRVGTSRTYLYHLAAEEGAGYRREPSPVLAAAIESATRDMHKASGGRLPRIYRTDMVSACRECAFAKKCLGEIALRAEFPLGLTYETLTETEGGQTD